MTRRSKYYTAEESWTKRPAWAFEIPLSAIRSEGHVVLRCETGPGTRHYENLKVPFTYLKENLSGFWIREDRQTVSLFLSAEAQDRFTDKRGSGNVSFAPYADK